MTVAFACGAAQQIELGRCRSFAHQWQPTAGAFQQAQISSFWYAVLKGLPVSDRSKTPPRPGIEACLLHPLNKLIMYEMEALTQALVLAAPRSQPVILAAGVLSGLSSHHCDCVGKGPGSNRPKREVRSVPGTLMSRWQHTGRHCTAAAAGAAHCHVPVARALNSTVVSFCSPTISLAN
jgi:hypothetical protein